VSECDREASSNKENLGPLAALAPLGGGGGGGDGWEGGKRMGGGGKKF